MSPRVREASDDDDDDDGLDARWEPDAEQDEDDGAPLTHLSDEDYEEFVARDLPDATPSSGSPPVVPILIGLTLLIIVLAMWLA